MRTRSVPNLEKKELINQAKRDAKPRGKSCTSALVGSNFPWTCQNTRKLSKKRWRTASSKADWSMPMTRMTAHYAEKRKTELKQRAGKRSTIWLPIWRGERQQLRRNVWWRETSRWYTWRWYIELLLIDYDLSSRTWERAAVSWRTSKGRCQMKRLKRINVDSSYSMMAKLVHHMKGGNHSWS